MAFNANTWYAIQNFGSDFFIACQDVGSCATGTNDLANAELFQLTSVNGTQPYYIRPKAINADANGNAYCVNLNGGQPTIAPCSSASAIWGIQNWTAQSSSSGLFFFSTSTGDSQRLYLGDNGTYSLSPYSSSVSDSERSYMQWAVSSRAVINDQSYSTIPAAIASGTVITTTASTNLTTTTTTASSSTSSSSSASVTSSSALPASTSSRAASSVSTQTVVITPTVTASQPANTSGSQSSSSSAIGSLRNGAYRTTLDLEAKLVLLIALPSLVRWLC